MMLKHEHSSLIELHIETALTVQYQVGGGKLVSTYGKILSSLSEVVVYKHEFVSNS